MGPWRDREPLVHWCHGATGAVLLFCKAHQQLSVAGRGGPAYLDTARRAGEAVWQRGLLKKGPGACHGVSGSAYALLALHRACPEGPERSQWLARAQQFALFMDRWAGRAGARGRPRWLHMPGPLQLCPLICATSSLPSRSSTPAPCCSQEFREGAHTPDHLHSLYEGTAAAVCLWADLLGDPEAAAFPMFQVDF